MRWFGHLECKSRDDWMSACRNVDVLGKSIKAGTGRFGMCVNDDMEVLGF